MRPIKKRKKINQEEREYIEYLRNEEGKSIGKIAKILKRSKSSISEELRRIKRGAYSAKRAEVSKKYRQYHKTKDWMKIVANAELHAYVERHLKIDWSPEEIAGRIEYVDTHIPQISTPSIYKFVYSVHGRPLEQYLRYGKRTGKSAYERKMTIDGRTFIDKRPKKANTRRFFWRLGGRLHLLRQARQRLSAGIRGAQNTLLHHQTHCFKRCRNGTEIV